MLAPVKTLAVILVLFAATVCTSCKKTGSDAEPCTRLADEFRTVRRAGSLACSADDDCACFAGVDPEVPCGGVIDAKTAQKLATIEKKMSGPPACRLDHQCAAQICNPGCAAGRCVATKPSFH
ncbi:MAG: hypothetical protein JWP87_5963 [Labilithrix sp.]|nr:hypothetical protein [Labilithrix sp.]